MLNTTIKIFLAFILLMPIASDAAKKSVTSKAESVAAKPVSSNDKGADYLEKAKKAMDAKDYEAAMKYSKLAAFNGSSSAYTYIGIMYLYGYGVEVNNTEAMKYLKMAADAKDPQAIAELANIREGGSAPRKIAEEVTRVVPEKPIKQAQKAQEENKQNIIENKPEEISQSIAAQEEVPAKNKAGSCAEGNLDICTKVLEEALNDVKFKLTNESASAALQIMKDSSHLTDEQKIIFYDYSKSKLLRPEKETANRFISELVSRGNISAKLRFYEDKLSITSVLVEIGNKSKYCQDAKSFNTSRFDKSDMERYNNIIFKCN
jgi:hypothetical protein